MSIVTRTRPLLTAFLLLLVSGMARANLPPSLLIAPPSGPVGAGAVYELTLDDPDGLADIAQLRVEVEIGGTWHDYWPGQAAFFPLLLRGNGPLTLNIARLGPHTRIERDWRWRTTVTDRAGESVMSTTRYWDPLDPPFVEVNGLDLEHKDLPFHYAGLNNYYAMVYSAEPNLVYGVDEVLDEAEAMGLSVLRTWAFNDGAAQWNALQTSPGVYDETTFRALDRVVQQAGEHGLHLILTLVNNWDDYGGMNQYVAWSPTASVHDDFYTDGNCKRWYKDHIEALLYRVNTLTGVAYRDDPTILAWELANEARCPADPSGVTLRNWTTEMAGHIKTHDPNHLVTTGSEGFYGIPDGARNPFPWMSNEGVDFLQHHAVADIDFAVIHTWPDIWGMHLSVTRQWILDHLADAGTTLGKPLVVEEFGKVRPEWLRDNFYQEIYDQIFLSADAGGAAAGSHFWHLIHDDYAPFDDGFGVFYPADQSTITIIETEAARIHDL